MLDSVPKDTTEEQFYAFNYTPVSFICAGCVHDDKRELAQDAYRLCFKNDAVDDMSDNDEQDLTHLMAVIAQALGIIASRRVNGGTIDVMTMQGSAPTVADF